MEMELDDEDIDLIEDDETDDEIIFSNISSESSDESEEELELLILLLLEALQTTREPAVVREWTSWRYKVAYSIQEGTFTRMYRMRRESFLLLLHHLAPLLEIDVQMSQVRSQGQAPIDVEMMLLMTIRWLAQGSVHDIRNLFGCSESSFYRVVYHTLEAIINCDTCPALKIEFPTTLEEMQNTATGFRQISTEGIMTGAIGAIDGWLCTIACPRESEGVNQASFYSGNYGQYGLNVQAVCDSHSCFTYLSVKCPGSTNDVVAFESCSLSQLCASFPPSFYLVGDNAYICNETMLTPYSGGQKNNPSQDSFNFFLSQIRIRIEQAFGLVVNKWRIFRSPLTMKLKNVVHVIQAAFLLHNFCVRQREFIPNMMADLELNDIDYLKYIDAETLLAGRGKNLSLRRERIRRYLEESGIRRPTYNIQQNMP